MKVSTAKNAASSVAATVSSSLISSLGTSETAVDGGTSSGALFKKTLAKIAQQKQSEKQAAAAKASSASSSGSEDEESGGVAQDDDLVKNTDQAASSADTSDKVQSAQDDDVASSSNETNKAGFKHALVQTSDDQNTSSVKKQKTVSESSTSSTTAAGGIAKSSLETLLTAFLQEMQASLKSTLPTQSVGTMASSAAGTVNGVSGSVLSGVLSTLQAGGASLALTGTGSTGAMPYSADLLSLLAEVQQEAGAISAGAQGGQQAGTTASGTIKQDSLKAAQKALGRIEGQSATVTVGVEKATLQRTQEAAGRATQSDSTEAAAAPYRAEVSSITLGLQQAGTDQNTVPQVQEQKNLSGTSEELATELTGLARAEGAKGQNTGEQSGDTADNGAASQDNMGGQLAASAQASVNNFSSLLEVHSEQTQALPTEENAAALQSAGTDNTVTTALSAPSSDDGTLSMTIMMGERTPVTVHVENSNGITTGIVLESSDPDVVKHLSNNKHELVDALASAGLDASTMKIDVVAPAQNTDGTGTQSQGGGQQDTASGGNASGNLFGSMADQSAGQNNGGNAWRSGSVFGAHEVKEIESADASAQRAAWSRDGRVINITA